jgi:hypothetical protein
MTVESRSALLTDDLIPVSATLELGGTYHKPIPDRRRANHSDHQHRFRVIGP